MSVCVLLRQTTLLQFWEKTALAMSGIQEAFRGHVPYQFTTLKVPLGFREAGGQQLKCLSIPCVQTVEPPETNLSFWAMQNQLNILASHRTCETHWRK